MKITKEHYSVINGAITNYLNLYTTEELQKMVRMYQTNKKFNDYRVAFIWRVFHAIRSSDQTINDLIHYSSYKDAHIETALKKMFKEFGLLYP